MTKKYEYFEMPFDLPRESLKRNKTHKPRMTHSVGDHIYYANIAPRKYLAEQYGDRFFNNSWKMDIEKHYPKDERKYLEEEFFPKWGVIDHGVMRKSNPRAYHVKNIPTHILSRQHSIPYAYGANIQERIKLSKKEPRIIISPEELKYNPAAAIEYNLARVARHKRVTKGKKSFRS